MTLAQLGAKDILRATADGVVPARIARLEVDWSKLCEYFGADSDPASLTYDGVNAYVAKRRADGMTGQTIVKEVQAIKRACAMAHRNGWLSMLPGEWPRVKRDAIGQKKRGKFHPPAILRAWFTELDGNARDEAEIALLTGLRAAELKRITAQWIEPADQGLMDNGIAALLRVPASSAKSRRDRVVPLTHRAFEILKARAERTPEGLPLLYQGSHKTAYRTACERIGYKSPISLRDLRHAYGTIMERTSGIAAARDGLGHTNLGTTNRYVTGDLARVSAGVLKIGQMVGIEKSAQSPEVAYMARDTGFEPVAFAFGGQRDHIYDHVTSCNYCKQRALECIEMQQNTGRVGIAESAYTTRRRFEWPC